VLSSSVSTALHADEPKYPLRIVKGCFGRTCLGFLHHQLPIVKTDGSSASPFLLRV